MMATALIENRPTLTAPDPSFSPAGGVHVQLHQRPPDLLL